MRYCAINFRVPEGIAGFACGTIAHAILRCSIEGRVAEGESSDGGSRQRRRLDEHAARSKCRLVRLVPFAGFT
jgi:hypothetical protein